VGCKGGEHAEGTGKAGRKEEGGRGKWDGEAGSVGKRRRGSRSKGAAVWRRRKGGKGRDIEDGRGGEERGEGARGGRVGERGRRGVRGEGGEKAGRGG